MPIQGLSIIIDDKNKKSNKHHKAVNSSKNTNKIQNNIEDTFSEQFQMLNKLNINKQKHKIWNKQKKDKRKKVGIRL